VDKLIERCSQFIEKICDSHTGAYFTGTQPKYGQLINGAMKVLSALDWLGVPIHYPDRLIDSALHRLPASDGCHLVDTVYVFYRCLQQTDHRKLEIQEHCSKILDATKQHFNSDGGLSYYINRSQTGYYGVKISRGLPESDIHGTVLLSWAIAMILEILDLSDFGWRVIRP
jgi:hypothetical protein